MFLLSFRPHRESKVWGWAQVWFWLLKRPRRVHHANLYELHAEVSYDPAV